MKKNQIVAILAVLLSLVGFSIVKYADGQSSIKSSPKDVNWAAERAQALFSPQQKARTTATYQLMRVPSEVERTIGAQALQAQFWQNRDAEGSTVLAIQILGNYGSEYIVPTLVDHIGFQVDSKTWKVGAKRAAIALYPVAATLSNIGDLSVRRNVLQKIYRTQSERELRLSLWVLNETETTEIARYLVDVSRQDASKRVATEEVEQATTNLKRAQVLLEKPDELLSFDPSTP